MEINDCRKPCPAEVAVEDEEEEDGVAAAASALPQHVLCLNAQSLL